MRVGWEKRIDAAEKRGYFSERDRDLAASWVTCACGQQDPRLHVRPGGEPRDDRLWYLGLAFSQTVRNGGKQFENARGILAEIEERAAIVLRDLGNEGGQ
jgi:hypothetical protein